MIAGKKKIKLNNADTLPLRSPGVSLELFKNEFKAWIVNYE